MNLKFTIVPAMLLALAHNLAAAGAGDYLDRPPEWWKSDQARAIAANILSWQSNLGGWPKNVDTTVPCKQQPQDLKPTFDNGATTDELRFLARFHATTGDDRCRTACVRGIDYILEAQYPTGGWPQFYPPGKQYHRHITFNDNSMVRLMEFLREVHCAGLFAFLPETSRTRAGRAFDEGIRCILKCQIRVNGKLTAWCAQHDEIDYSPRPGRAYELVSLSGSESVGIVRLLMSIENPTPDVMTAIDSAVAWFESARLKGIKVVEVDDKDAPRGKDRRVVEDPAAPPMWARFYEIGANRPIFCDRDGVPKYRLSDIGYERRNGYRWLGDWPQTLLEKEYPAWKRKRELAK